MPFEFPFTVKDIVLGGLIPAGLVVAVCLLSARFLASHFTRSIAANWAIGIASFVGIRLLALTPWKPVNHWHWLPYIGLACAVLSPLLIHKNAAIRFATAVVAAVASAYLLVPEWDSLPQPGSVMICLFAVIVIGVWLVMRPLSQRIPHRSLAIVFAGSMLGATLILTLAGSLRFGQIGGSIAAGFFGLMVAEFVARTSDKLTDLSFMFCVLGGGVMLVGQLNSSSDVPLVCYLIPPLAPLTLWLGRLGPLAKLTGKSRMTIDIVLPAIVVLTAVCIAAGTQLLDDTAVY